MKKSILCLVIAVMTVLPLFSCGGDMIHQSNGVAVDIKCPHPYTEEVPALMPTCEKGGHSAYTRCSLCGEILTEYDHYSKAGHVLENDVCTVCGKDCSDPDKVKPIMQLFTTQAVLYTDVDVWEFSKNSFTLYCDRITFASADESVATVDEKGVVTPVSVGETVITCTAQNGDGEYLTELAVTVKESYLPITDADKSLFAIMQDENIPEFKSYKSWDVYIGSIKTAFSTDDEYEPGPVEIWQDTLQYLLCLAPSEIDLSEGVGKKGYDVYFDMYYKPYAENTLLDGGYSTLTMQPWSIYKFPADVDMTMYRMKFGDTAMMDFTEGQYAVYFVVRKGGLVLGWFEAPDFVWTNSCTEYVEYAKNHPEITR